MLPVIPVLRSECREDRMFDREDEGAPRYKTVMHFPTDEVEVLNIMQCK